jgi:hypothetical protein
LGVGNWSGEPLGEGGNMPKYPWQTKCFTLECA